jgi:hypothetical protein
MKQLYIIAVSLSSLLFWGCVKDSSTGSIHPLPAVVVNGLEDNYTVYTHKDTLHIHPSVQNGDNYNYYWTAFTTVFIQGQAPSPDTLSRTKDLDYVMLLNPGQYILVFNVEDKKTGVTQLINVNMSVATLNMNGWYLLKDNQGVTDFDFVYNGGRIDNWIAFYNNGKSLEGNAVKAVFTPSFMTTLTSTDIFNALTVISDKDAGIYRIDNGAKIWGFDSMFFKKPAVRNLQNIFQPTAANSLGLINDNKAYTLTKGALFTDMSGNYKCSAVVGVAAMPIGFDENSKSVIFYDGVNFDPVGSNGSALKNMNAELVWMNGYAGIRSVAMMLFRMPDGRGELVKLNGSWGYLAGYSSPLIMAWDTLPATHGLMSASVIGGDYDADYIFYAKDNSIYVTDLATVREGLQVTLPAGETITCIQHIKYPQQVDATIQVTTDCLAVASYSNGHYKIWLYKISSTGTIQALSQPNFEGVGRVANITYMEQGSGSRVF